MGLGVKQKKDYEIDAMTETMKEAPVSPRLCQGKSSKRPSTHTQKVDDLSIGEDDEESN